MIHVNTVPVVPGCLDFKRSANVGRSLGIAIGAESFVGSIA